MTSDTELIKKRFIELAKKSYNSGIFVFTEFLCVIDRGSRSHTYDDCLAEPGKIQSADAASGKLWN